MPLRSWVLGRWSLGIATILSSGIAWAEDAAETTAAPEADASASDSGDEPADELPEGALGSLPGSPKPQGMGLSPHAPPTPPAPGGRAPSFGAPTEPGEWNFNLSGRMSGLESVGIGRRPSPAPEGYEGQPLHVPARVEGKTAFWAGAGLTLNLSYGNSVVAAFTNLYMSMNGKERRGYHAAQSGPAIGQAYLQITPPQLDNWRLAIKVGGFVENYGGQGEWGWGIFGPFLATRGYGEGITADYDLSRDLRLWLSQGVNGVPGVPEGFARGDYTGWTQPGVSSLVHHYHAGLTIKNLYTIKAHYAHAMGTDEREYLIPDTTGLPRDGTMDVYILESHFKHNPYGHLGISAAFWDMQDARSVHESIWWGLDWTQGGGDLTEKFLGHLSNGTGQLMAAAAEYDFSVASILYHPGGFDGRAADIFAKVAVRYQRTVASDDEAFEGSDGVAAGVELNYSMLSWLMLTSRSYFEQRQTLDSTGVAYGQWRTASISPGLYFRGDWNSNTRVELAYSRHFYNSVADSNPAEPLDRNVITLGALVEF